MSTHVRLRVFSCIDDPEWDLEPPMAQRFRPWYDHALAQRALFKTTQATSGPPAIPDDGPSTGYKGFDVSVDGGDVVRVYGDSLLASLAEPHSILGKPADQFLFDTKAAELKSQFGFEPSLLTSRSVGRITGLAPSCPSNGVPEGPLSYPPANSRWFRPSEQLDRNCYNYANDVLSVDPVHPFSQSGRRRVFNARELHHALVSGDKLRFAGCSLATAERASAEEHYVVACLGAAGDYHFIRLDRSGIWSHKYGGGAVTNLDDTPHGRHHIQDLCQAQFHASLQLVGIYLSNPDVRDRLLVRGGGPPPSPL